MLYFKLQPNPNYRRVQVSMSPSHFECSGNGNCTVFRNIDQFEFNQELETGTIYEAKKIRVKQLLNWRNILYYRRMVSRDGNYIYDEWVNNYNCPSFGIDKIYIEV